MSFKTRPAQTRVKHAILGEYVGAWAGIIRQGIRRRASRVPGGIASNFVFLDGFAGAGSYERDADKPDEPGPVWGSPIIGIQALVQTRDDMEAANIRPTFSAILVEEDSENFRCLVSALSEAGFPLEVGVTSCFERERLGGVSAINDDFRGHSQDIVRHLPTQAFLLAFIDPWGTSAHFDAVAPFLNRKKTDLILYFPSHRVALHGESQKKQLWDLTPTDEENIRRLDFLFGTVEWRRIAEQEAPQSEKIWEYAELYRSRLGQARNGLSVKSIPLRFSTASSEDNGYHLFLVTENADGALKMNSILRKAEARKYWEYWKDDWERTRQEEEAQGALLLFPQDELAGAVAPSTEPPAPPMDEVCAAVQSQFDGRKELRFGELKQGLANNVFTGSEIKKAVRFLRREGILNFQGNSLKNSTKLTAG